MPSTLKSIIATVFYLCTLTTPVQIPHDRLQQLEEGFSSLINNIAYHQNHVTGPFTKALLDQMTAVKTQVSDLAVDLGCAEQKQKDGLCWILKAEELRLRYDIVTKKMDLYLDEEEKEAKKCKAGIERIELYLDEEEKEVKKCKAGIERMELYLDEEEKEVKQCKAEIALLLEQEHGGWNIA